MDVCSPLMRGLITFAMVHRVTAAQSRNVRELYPPITLEDTVTGI